MKFSRVILALFPAIAGAGDLSLPRNVQSVSVCVCVCVLAGYRRPSKRIYTQNTRFKHPTVHSLQFKIGSRLLAKMSIGHDNVEDGVTADDLKAAFQIETEVSPTYLNLLRQPVCDLIVVVYLCGVTGIYPFPTCMNVSFPDLHRGQRI